MDEHDDDLESEVQEGAENETEDYSVTGDELGEPAADEVDADEDPNLDDDDADL